MTQENYQDPVVRVFRGNDNDQFEAYIHFYDETGLPLSTKLLCQQKSDSSEEFTEDKYVLDLDAFHFYEWGNVGRIECHSDIKEICLSDNLRPKVGTIEFLNERRKDFIKRGRFTFIDEEDVVTQYDISDFFKKMLWEKPVHPIRNPELNLFDLVEFPVKVVSHFQDRNFESTVRFFDSLGNEMNLEAYSKEKDFEYGESYEEWTVIDLASFLKEMWGEVSVVESRSDLTALDRFRHVKGNIDYLIYCRANNYKKLPEYLYKRIQTRRLDDFLQDIRGPQV